MKFLAAAIITLAVPGFAQQAITWRFDNLTKIRDARVTTVGTPQVVDTSIGKAIHFEGHGNTNGSRPESGNPVGDALYLDTRATLGRCNLYLRSYLPPILERGAGTALLSYAGQQLAITSHVRDPNR